MKRLTILLILTILAAVAFAKGLTVTGLTCELRHGLVVTDGQPRLGWQMTSPNNGTTQSAYQIQVMDKLTGRIILDTKKVKRHDSQLIPVSVGNGYYTWKVRVWDEKGKTSKWSETADFIRQDVRVAFGKAQWVGAITKADAHTPEGRSYTGEGLKKSIPEWDTANPLSRRSIYVAKNFHINQSKKIVAAVMNVCGLGFSEITINGQRVTDAEFSPEWSDYDKSVFYNTYDVKELLKSPPSPPGGEMLAPSATEKCPASQSNLLNQSTVSSANGEVNIPPSGGLGGLFIKVLLGNGFYNEQGGRYHKLRISFGPPTLKMHLVVTYYDGSEDEFVTDDSWQYAPSEITLNSIYGGEDYDARIKPEWHPVVIQEGPKGMLKPQMAPPVKVMATYSPVSVNVLTDVQCDSACKSTKHTVPHGTFILDMGQNLSGVPEIKIHGKSGQVVRLYVSETLTKEGACNQRQTGRQHYYQYTLNGQGTESYRPRFSYYGFRYIQVEGAVMKHMPNPENLPVIDEIKSCFVYNSAEKVSTFKCSNDLVNNTHELIDKATRSNMQSVFTDCPHREKLGWLEQDWLNGPGLFMNYDLTGFAAQEVMDMADAQRPNGSIPTTAPEYVVFKGKWLDIFAESPEWAGAFIMMPWEYYKQYGDDSLLRDYYPKMLEYVNYLATQDSCFILKQGLGDWYDYGNYRAGFARHTTIPLVSTAHYYRWTDMLRQIAGLLGKSNDETYLEARCLNIKEAWIKNFYKPVSIIGSSGNSGECFSSQTGMAIALNLHLCPEADRNIVLDSLVADIHRHGDRLTTGDIGNRYLYEVLCEENRQDVLYKMLNHYDVPGYGFQMKKGMTTLSEQWNPEMGSSMNHFMMGQIDGFHFTSLCGINIDRDHIIFNPQPVDDITFARGSTITPYGKVAIDWSENLAPNSSLCTKYTATITIPVGMTATFKDKTYQSGIYTVEF